jgi:hypothetical protein
MTEGMPEEKTKLQQQIEERKEFNLQKKKRGRPKKSEIEAKKKRGQVGRPKGDASIINEYKARMLASPKSKRVLEKILEAALDDEHKHQAACMKMIADRILPVSAFEQEITKGNGKSSIQINISGVGGVNVSGSEEENNQQDYIEAEYTDKTDED